MALARVASLREYYAVPSVRQRIREYCGDSGDGVLTCAYLTGMTDTEAAHVTGDHALRYPASALEDLMAVGRTSLVAAAHPKCRRSSRCPAIRNRWRTCSATGGTCATQQERRDRGRRRCPWSPTGSGAWSALTEVRVLPDFIGPSTPHRAVRAESVTSC